MFVLDTNVVSELRRARSGLADRNVTKWAAGVSASTLFISAITVLELEQGVLLMERRDALQGKALRNWLDGHVLAAFEGRVLPVDTAVARHCARLRVPNPCAERDALIAATAMMHAMTVVTRNVKDFESTGVEILNPWDS
jgi:predicted nucleic acid-binding protein